MKQMHTTARLTVLAAAIITALNLGACDRFRNFTDQEHVQRAKDFEAKGELRTSEIELKNALSKNPNNAEARLLLGDIYLALDNGAGAEKEFRRVMELGANSESMKVSLGRAFLLQGKYKEVLDQINLIPQASPRTNAQILYLRGNAFVGLRQARDSCNAYEQSNKTDPAYIDAYRGLVYCSVNVFRDEQRTQELINKALALLENILAKSPDDFDALLAKGEMLAGLNKKEHAQAVYIDALKLRKHHIDANLALATLYLQEDKLNDAQRHIELVLKAYPRNVKAIYMSAYVDYRDKKYSQSRDKLLQALKLEPRHFSSLTLYGAVSFALGDYAQAEQILSRIVSFAPRNKQIRSLLTTTYLKQGKADLAMETFSPLLPQASDAETLALAGEVFIAVKQPIKAAEYFDKAFSLSPTDASLKARRGASLILGGDTESGVSELEKATHLENKSLLADGPLIMTYLRLGQYDNALQAVAVFEKKQPNSPFVHNLRGSALLAKGDLSAARTSFEQALSIDPTFMPAVKNIAQLDIRENKLDSAKNRYRHVLDADKNNVQAMLGLADLAAAGHDNSSYLEWISKAAKSDPKALQPQARLAAFYLDNKEPQRALVIAREAQNNNKDNPLAWELLGRTQLAAGESENAIASFSKATQLFPENAQAYFELGVALAAGNKTSASRQSFTKALTLNPKHSEALSSLVHLEIQEKRWGEALHLAQSKISDDPKSPLGSTLEGEVFQSQGQYTQAAKSYERAFTLSQSGLTLLSLHQAKVLSGNAKEADTTLINWLNQHPADIRGRVYMAESLVMRGDSKSAIAFYEQALQKAPDNPTLLNQLANAFQQTQDKRALATAEKAYKLMPDNPAIQDTLGWILLEQGQHSRALDLLKLAAAKAPNFQVIRYHYAVALHRMGQAAKARQELDAALAIKSPFPGRADAEALRKKLL